MHFWSQERKQKKKHIPDLYINRICDNIPPVEQWSFLRSIFLVKDVIGFESETDHRNSGCFRDEPDLLFADAVR